MDKSVIKPNSIKENKKFLSIPVSEKMFEKVGGLAKNYKMKKTEIVRQMIEHCLAEIEEV